MDRQPAVKECRDPADIPPTRLRMRTTALIIASALFMEQLDSTVLSTALPTMARSFGVDPLHLYISISGVSYFFFANTPTLTTAFGKDLNTAAARKARRAHVVEVILSYVAPPR